MVVVFPKASLAIYPIFRCVGAIKDVAVVDGVIVISSGAGGRGKLNSTFRCAGIHSRDVAILNDIIGCVIYQTNRHTKRGEVGDCH